MQVDSPIHSLLQCARNIECHLVAHAIEESPSKLPESLQQLHTHLLELRRYFDTTMERDPRLPNSLDFADREDVFHSAMRMVFAEATGIDTSRHELLQLSTHRFYFVIRNALRLLHWERQRYKVPADLLDAYKRQGGILFVNMILSAETMSSPRGLSNITEFMHNYWLRVCGGYVNDKLMRMVDDELMCKVILKLYSATEDSQMLHYVHDSW